MPGGSERLSNFVEENALDVEVVTLDSSTRTSKMAAEALGCEVAQIAKSIVFTGEDPVVVVISGDRRVDSGKLSGVLGNKAEIADADAVRRDTGYVIGGVPPFPHDEGVRVLLDSSLTRFGEVWAAAGTPHSVMRVKVRDLERIVGVGYVDVGG
ncbi:MAG: YbaK/EbsC family protein [Candidatus Bathyarchaeota archaeon]|jgi:prolyl-tRNA editing enzyme YbaK/EbsC (Cys-tRNA(Pro) deacylase)